MSLLPLAILNPSLKVLPVQMDYRAQVDFWLKNPALLHAYPKRVAASAEKARMLTNPAGFHDLLLKLQDAAKPLRAEMWAKYPGVECTSYHDVQKVMESNHIDGRERAELTRFLTTLSTIEYEWLRAFLQEVVDAKEAALQERLDSQNQDYHTHDELAA